MSSSTVKRRSGSSQQPETVTSNQVTKSNLSAWYKQDASIPTILVASGPSLLRQDLDLLLQLRHRNSGTPRQANPDPPPQVQNLPPAPPPAAAAAANAGDPPRPIVAIISDVYRWAPWADLLYSSDARWWNYHRPHFTGEKWTTKRNDPSKGSIFRLCSKTIANLNLRYMLGKYDQGLSFDQSIIHFGGNSGFQLLNLVILAGAKNIGLLGYDMQINPNDPEKEHFFGKHPKGFSSPVSCFQKWIRNFNFAAGQLRNTDIRVVNLTRETALTCFPRMSIENFFNE